MQRICVKPLLSRGESGEISGTRTAVTSKSDSLHLRHMPSSMRGVSICVAVLGSRDHIQRQTERRDCTLLSLQTGHEAQGLPQMEGASSIK